MPFVRAHGAAGGSLDEERWIHVRDELSRSQQGRAELQRDGPCESGARGVVSLSRLRARRQGHTRARDFAWAAQDTRGVLAQGLRSAPERGRTARADWRARRHHGRRLYLRIPCHALRTPAVRCNAVRRRRGEHHGLKRSNTARTASRPQENENETLNGENNDISANDRRYRRWHHG